ncbi:MAG: YkgJ family cysteine cluster protein [Desulfonatronovibrionaceae bacterium]
MSEPVFECLMCGSCCQGQGGIVTALHEQQRMADYLGLSVQDFFSRYLEIRNRKYCIKTREDGYCIFFREGKGCDIHPVKPDVCRAWPFFRGNLLDELSFDLAKDYCPGINPRAGHADFVRQGISYLIEHGLADGLQKGPANALLIKDLNECK